jgi:hypothetical protein
MGGPGDDTFFVHDTLDFIDEGIVFPTIPGGGNYDIISGNAGDNNLYVNWGDDTAYAGAGFDHIDLTGRGAGDFILA